ncbi:ribonuclease P protein component [Estrella lausannensis]|uniref:Ribonuclease P protein component n=1 Tax=Estrella lausannensis TaxID=483423 RepID=A0A0H5DRS1_9BACT|nr:ribonuclease P protein component [Estrella lausannensis]CRX38414.1 Ribonuclease P protein component [Estrella lausannensis]
MFKARGFPKQARLTKRVEFIKVKVGAASHTGSLVIIDQKATRRGHCRLGITVSRKFGNAVLRNRFKRTVREVFRTMDWRSKSFDFHIRPRAKAREAKTNEIRDELNTLLGPLIDVT